jgi:exonuclease VII small subunit
MVRMDMQKFRNTVKAVALLLAICISAIPAQAEGYFCAAVVRVDENCKAISPTPEDSFDVCLRDEIQACLESKVAKLSEALNECGDTAVEAVSECQSELDKTRKRVRKLKQQLR